MKLIKYIGEKKLKRDTVAGTGLTWTPGQVQEVDNAAAAFLLKYPSVWEEDSDEPQGDLLDDPGAPEPQKQAAPAKAATKAPRKTGARGNGAVKQGKPVQPDTDDDED